VSGGTGARAVAAAAADALGTGVLAARPVAGGDLNDAYALELAGGRRAFAKTAAGVAPGTYEAEAAGLRWLAEAAGPAMPEVLAVTPTLLVLAWIDEGRLDAAGEEALGRGLAGVHGAGAPAHGATPPGAPDGLRLGPLILPSAPVATWAECYAAQRLEPALRAAVDRRAIDAAGAGAVERVCARMDDLAGPPEPPARLHGDLWSGNVLADAAGRPVLVDPAAHGGHREVDLAMLDLFGAVPPRTRAAYAEASPLAAGHGSASPCGSSSRCSSMPRSSAAATAAGRWPSPAAWPEAAALPLALGVAGALGHALQHAEQIAHPAHEQALLADVDPRARRRGEHDVVAHADRHRHAPGTPTSRCPGRRRARCRGGAAARASRRARRAPTGGPGRARAP